MTDTRSIAQVREMATNVARLLVVAGIVPPRSKIDLQEGQPSAGRPFRMMLDTGGLGEIPHPLLRSQGYLGWTKVQAWNALYDLRNALWNELEIWRNGKPGKHPVLNGGHVTDTMYDPIDYADHRRMMAAQ